MSLRDIGSLRYKVQVSPIILHAFAETKKSGIPQKARYSTNSLDPFVFACGSSDYANADVAAEIASKSAVWSINLLKAKHSYWRDKNATGRRMVRSVNLTLYHKRREENFSNGIASSLGVLFFGERQFYIFAVGNIQIFMLRNAQATTIHKENNDYLGIQKKAPKFTYHTEVFFPKDLFLFIHGANESRLFEEIQMFFRKELFSQVLLERLLNQLVLRVNNRNIYCAASLIYLAPGGV